MKISTTLVWALLGLCALVSARTFEEDFVAGFNTLVREGKETEELNNALKNIEYPHLFRGYYKPKRINDGQVICEICNFGVGIIIKAANSGVEPELMANAAIYLCNSLKIEDEDVCEGVVNVNLYTLLYIVTNNNTKATSERMCSMLLQDFNCYPDAVEPWTIEIPPVVPTPTTPPKPTTLPTPIKAEETPLKIVQLSDLHYDPNYEVGSDAACSKPLCCQAGSVPANEEAAAGYWGDYRNCDVPWHNLIDLLDQVVIEHRNIDYVYFTGDIIDHKVWKTDIQTNKEAITKTYKHFKKSFGNLPVYPILGNHEPHPVNQYSYDVENSHEINTMWIFELAADLWSQWLPEEAQKTIRTGGYYTVKTPNGHRVIALNSNVCYTFNFWLFYDDKDPFGQLEWLTKTLLEAEKNGEKVHILSHIPTGDSTCLHNWSREYVKIVNRFYNTISAQFNGHTHDDDFVIFHAPDNITATSIAFNGGSITTYANLNPNYKVYYVDPASFEIANYDSWTYNLTEANWDPRVSPKWYKLYDLLGEYKITNAKPSSISKLVENMALETKSTLVQAYFKNKNRNADTVMKEGCDSKCEIANLCYMVTYLHGHNYHCNTLTGRYNSAHPNKP